MIWVDNNRPRWIRLVGPRRREVLGVALGWLLTEDRAADPMALQQDGIVFPGGDFFAWAHPSAEELYEALQTAGLLDPAGPGVAWGGPCYCRIQVADCGLCGMTGGFSAERPTDQWLLLAAASLASGVRVRAEELARALHPGEAVTWVASSRQRLDVAYWGAGRREEQRRPLGMGLFAAVCGLMDRTPRGREWPVECPLPSPSPRLVEAWPVLRALNDLRAAGVGLIGGRDDLTLCATYDRLDWAPDCPRCGGTGSLTITTFDGSHGTLEQEPCEECERIQGVRAGV